MFFPDLIIRAYAKYINKKKVKLFKTPVHSKNPILIILNILILSLIVLFFRINIIHVRSRAPAWSCYFAAKITRCKLVTTFHGTYNFNSSLKKLGVENIELYYVHRRDQSIPIEEVSETLASFVKEGKKIADLIDNSRVEIIDICGHMMLREEADRVLKVLKHFIIEHNPPKKLKKTKKKIE